PARPPVVGFPAFGAGGILNGKGATLVVPAVLAVLLVLAQAPATPPAPPPARVAVPAAPEVTAEVARLVEAARRRFEARDAGGVLAHVSEQYRSAGFTKSALRQQLLGM